MKTRKLVLLIADALLIVALILQICFKTGDKTKVYKLSEEPDEIAIAGTSGNFSIVKENDAWFVGDKKYPANETYVTQIVDSAKSVKVLDKVASANSEAAFEKYELAEDQRITVTVKKGGTVVRTIIIGKDTNAGSQTYVMIDDSKDVYLSAGNLHSDFDKTVNYLRSKSVYDVDKASITSVGITTADNSWAVTKMGSGTDVAWNCSESSVQLDETKASSWFDSLSAMTTTNWYDEGADLGGNAAVYVKIGTVAKTISLEIYEIPAADEDSKPSYWGKCSETPYPFEIANYSVQRYLKTLADLSK